VVAVRGIKHWIILAVATVTLVGIANFVTERVVTAFVEFQQKVK
jgi:hypothetical protein